MLKKWQLIEIRRLLELKRCNKNKNSFVLFMSNQFTIDESDLEQIEKVLSRMSESVCMAICSKRREIQEMLRCETKKQWIEFKNKKENKNE